MVRHAILESIRTRVRQGRYVMTLQAEEEMLADGLTVRDIEAAILGGEVSDVQGDPQTRARKYVIDCLMWQGAIHVVCRLGPTGRIVVIAMFRERLEWGGFR